MIKRHKITAKRELRQKDTKLLQSDTKRRLKDTILPQKDTK